MNDLWPSRISLIGLTWCLLVALSAGAEDLAITQVQPDRTLVESEKGKAVTFRFGLTAPAIVTLQLFDGRELMIRQVQSSGVLAAGEHRLAWDMKDHSGRLVPPEAYTYAMEARSNDGQLVRYDLADATGGDPVTPRDVAWNPATGSLSYVLDKPARVNVRLGLNEGGPLLRTLLSWVVRPAGLQQERWDGLDESRVLNLGAHPRLITSVEAFALPANSIIVGAPQSKVLLVDRLPSERVERPKAKASAKRMYAHAQQSLESRGDFAVNLKLPPDLPRTPTGVPIVTTTIPVRLEVDEKDRERALTRRFEPVFFVDGQFAFENEVGFVPMTWNFDPAALNSGEHYLTVNLRGYEGNFGMATVKIDVRKAASTMP